MRERNTLWIAIVAAIVAIAGLAQWTARRADAAQAQEPKKADQPAPGRAKRLTTVYIRGDAVGQHLDHTPAIGSMPTVRGELGNIDQNWVVLSSSGGKQSMIARSAVLMIVIDPEQ